MPYIDCAELAVVAIAKCHVAVLSALNAGAPQANQPSWEKFARIIGGSDSLFSPSILPAC